MPFYEFKCSCGEVTEELVKMGTERIDCPKCGQEAQKIMSTCSFSLKGGGWYADGYGLKKTENTASKTQTVSENKTENKPTSESNPS